MEGTQAASKVKGLFDSVRTGKHFLFYQGIQQTPGNAGSPILLWNQEGKCAVFGIATGGTGAGNFGPCFFDDAGLEDIFMDHKDGTNIFRAFFDDLPDEA